jgi:hypothetical protein
MFRVLSRWSLRLGVVFALVMIGSSSGTVSAVFGYALLGWVLVRAWPGCMADLRTVRDMLPGRSRHALSGSNAGF